MPTIENTLNLPEPLVAAVQNNGYSKGDAEYSVTELISPPRIAQLKRQHGDKVVYDVSDRIFSLFGTAIHTVLEKAASDRYIVEKRFYVEHDGTRIGGQIDLYDKETKVLSDWKITSRFTTADGPKDEWIAQGNINRYILWKNGLEVKGIRYVAIYRDWSKMMASRQRDYPQRQVAVLELPKWPKEQVEAYLSERISLHREAAVKLPMCNPRERWTKPMRWAVMQKGRKKALKLYDTEDEATGAVKDGQFVEERKGEETRCLFYCDVCAWCDFGRQVVMEAAGQ